MTTPAGAVTGKRQVSLDILRGLAVAAMILVNSPGSWHHIYAPLEHAAWNGWTPTDLIFPAFLFSAGAALRYSLGRCHDAGRWNAASALARRGIILILIGLGLNALDASDLSTLRIPGVLQRIGLCLMLSGGIFLATAQKDGEAGLQANRSLLVGITVAILIGYWLLLAFMPVPGFGAGRLDSQGSLPAWIDRSIFTPAHLWRGGVTAGFGVSFDPEGLLSTIPACANVVIGILTADVIKDKPPEKMIAPLLAAGGILTLLGLATDPFFPINKSLWTSSFVLLSSGISLYVLGLLVATADRGRWPNLFGPAVMFGRNAMTAYIASMLLGVISGLAFAHLPGRTPQGFGFHIAMAILADPPLASLVCAIGITALVAAPIAAMHKRQVYLNI